MSTPRHRGSAKNSDQLLAEVARRTPHSGDRLATILAAAVPRTDPGTELPGEREALVALRMARLSQSTHPGNTRPRALFVAKVLTVRAAVIIAIVGVSGAVAVAARAGVLPIASSGHTHHASPPAQANSTQPGRVPAVGRSDPPADPNGPSPQPTSAGSPAPSLSGLCEAYTNLALTDRGKTLQSPAFRALVTAAGGPQNIPGFCASLIPSPGPTPTTPARATPKPTRANPTHPTPPGTPNPHASNH